MNQEQEQTEKNAFECVARETKKANKQPKHIYLTYAKTKKDDKIILSSIKVWDNISRAGNYKDIMNKSNLNTEYLFIAEAKQIEE